MIPCSLTLMLTISATGNWLALAMPILIGAILLFFLWTLVLSLRDGINYVRKLHQIPCSRCQYHTGSLYLKCTVHPVSAFSEDALDCRDYAPAAQCPKWSPPNLFKPSKG